MEMNRWANGSCFCVLSLRTNSGKKKDARDIFNGMATFRKSILEAFRVQSTLRFLFSWSRCAILWTFCFPPRYSSNVRDFLVFVFSQSVVLSLAWLELIHEALVLRPQSYKSVPNEDLKLSHEQKSAGFFEGGNCRKSQKALGPQLWLSNSILCQAARIHLQYHFTSDSGLPALIRVTHWSFKVRWKLMQGHPWRGKHLQLWSLSIR